MGGRGRGGGTGSTVRAVANALGIARHEMATYSQHKPFEAPALYPIVQRALIPLELSNELQYIAELKLEMVNRFNESPYYLDHKETLDIRRYTDKYNQVHREKLHPDSASDVLKEKLSQLEEAEVEGEEDEDEDLSKVIADNAPNAVKLSEIKSYFGRKVAIDASMCLYQFLIAVRQDGSQLQSENGDTTRWEYLPFGSFYYNSKYLEWSNGGYGCSYIWVECASKTYDFL
uniref:XPGN domain-containing protein n=1 Tax=Heterorhabditis bacteriophora TaxID=37862 RepID=A0A1I7X0I4_HETBA